MNIFRIIILASLLLSTEAYSSSLPQSGACKDLQDQSLFRLIDSVTWLGKDAVIVIHGKKKKGKVTGMRPHDDGFKFSIFFESDIDEIGELSIFRIPLSNPSSYRFALVYYIDIPSEGRVINSNTGYKDASCIVSY